jgi:predicted AlkP superfamily pyrophosphatase or phosphodiesterase
MNANGKANGLVVMDVVGLTPRLLEHMPRLLALGEPGFQAELAPTFPAVTCSVQSTFLTGLPPSGHGVVGNGCYFRDLGEVYFWRQHNVLVQGEKVWETARRSSPGYKAANLCWWYAMGATTDVTLTPRPVYHADGRKSPDCYTFPPKWRETLTADLGRFPLFQYWGPGANIRSSTWISAAEIVIFAEDPDLTLVYLPHLDYDLQHFGPDSPSTHRGFEVPTAASRITRPTAH